RRWPIDWSWPRWTSPTARRWAFWSTSTGAALPGTAGTKAADAFSNARRRLRAEPKSAATEANDSAPATAGWTLPTAPLPRATPRKGTRRRLSHGRDLLRGPTRRRDRWSAAVCRAAAIGENSAAFRRRGWASTIGETLAG